MILYIIRHGEPNYATDSLTENGRKQAEALADRLSTHGFDEIYSSPLGRAIQTAEPTCERLGLTYIIEEWMSENLAWDDLSVVDNNGVRNWAFSCQNTKLLDSDYTSADWHTHPAFSSCKAAQRGYQRIKDGSDDFLSRLGYQREGKKYRITSPNDKRIAAFCHHGFGTSWLSHLLTIPPHIFWSSFDISHSGVTILSFINNPDGYSSPTCMCLSDMSHIYKEQLPLNAPIKYFG